MTEVTLSFQRKLLAVSLKIEGRKITITICVNMEKELECGFTNG